MITNVVTYNNIQLAIELFHQIFPNEELRKIDGKLNCFEKSLVSSEMTYYIHFENDIPIGISGIYKEPIDDESLWLGWFGVVGKCRRKHYGTKIMQFFLNKATEMNAKYVRLYTNKDNLTARKFYEGFGFIGEEYIKCIYDNLMIYSKSICNEQVPLWNNKILNL